MSEVVVVAEIELVAGQEKQGLAALRELCEQTHANDSGCALYALHRVSGEESCVMMIEKWESMEALVNHGGSEHIRAFGTSPTLAGAPKVSILEPTGFGDPDKGTL
jgi:quinol monooxygenase YgiN